MSSTPLLTLVRHRELIRELAFRDAKELHKGAALGGTWLILRPLIQAAAYVFILSFVFRTRLSSDATTLDYAIYVLGGMIPWQLFVHVIAVSPSLLRNHASVVKHVVYPIETLPIRSLVVGSLASLVMLCVYLLLAACNGSLSWTILLLPIPCLLLFVLLAGCSWTLMIAGALLADLREAVGAALNMAIFVTPVLLSPAMVRPEVWAWIRWNPLTHVVICFRDVLLGQFHLDSWCVFSIAAVLTLLVGSYLLSRLRLRIADFI